MAHEQRRVHFSGQVQGVGFRYRTCQIASRFDVTGYVQNLPDGRVLLVAEGEGGEVEAFLDAVGERMQAYVSELEIDTRPANGEFAEFGVRA